MAKPNSKALANINEQLAAEAASIADSIGAPSTNNIKIHGKVFTLPDGQIIQAPMRVVIIDFISYNKFFENEFDEDNPEPPTCFSISKIVGSMKPNKAAPDPQSKACNGCPMNEFGTAPNGKGKACKNTRLLAVTLPDVESDSDVEPIYTISISPTAIKGFDGYVGSVAKMFKAPPVRVITDVMFHPEKTYASLMFGNPQPNAKYSEDFARRGEAELLLTVEPAPATEVVKAKPKSRVKKKTRR